MPGSLALTAGLRTVVAGIVVGMRSADEVQRNAGLFEASVSGQVWADLRGEGLIDQRAPAGR